jgi:hypothetical protein
MLMESFRDGEETTRNGSGPRPAESFCGACAQAGPNSKKQAARPANRLTDPFTKMLGFLPSLSQRFTRSPRLRPDFRQNVWESDTQNACRKTCEFPGLAETVRENG